MMFLDFSHKTHQKPPFIQVSIYKVKENPVVQIRSTESQEFARNASKESRKYLEVGRSRVGVWLKDGEVKLGKNVRKTLGNPWKIHGKI